MFTEQFGMLGYIGPGMGLGAIGTVIAAILGFFALILGFIFYPLKKLVSKMKSSKKADVS
ncbi:MAG: hypothetical protein KC713_06140 [Candidatus Omnitrophica bacterium]|nr:hypothetical protein [Candidatus Omnitrophota bacterium]